MLSMSETKNLVLIVLCLKASDPPVFKWHLKQFGPSVNLFLESFPNS